MSLPKKFYRVEPPKIIRFLQKHHLTPGKILLVCIGFWSTVLITRVVIFWAVLHGMIPAIFIKGLHIHHFITGFFLLTVASILLSKEILSRYLWMAVIGSSLGLIFDEFLFWTSGHFNYWSIVNLIAVGALGTGIAVIYVYSKRYDLVKQKHLLELPGNPRLASALIPILFVLIVLTLMFTNDKLATSYAEQQSAPKIKRASQSFPPGQTFIDQYVDME